jgi:hypothetical protein
MIEFRVVNTDPSQPDAKTLQVWADSPNWVTKVFAGIITIDGKFTSNPGTCFVMDDQDHRKIADKCLVTRTLERVFA